MSIGSDPRPSLNTHSLVKEEQRLTADQLRSTLSRVSLDRYPELRSHTRDEIYGRGDQMSPGALFLAARMARGLEVRPGDVVLDVGCGMGESSIFLARHYGVRVVAVDLGIPAVTLSEKFSERSCGARVTALNVDITEPLPFAVGYFDAVFCMTSIHYFGVTTGFLKHLLQYVKRGGDSASGTRVSIERSRPIKYRTFTEPRHREVFWMVGKVSAPGITHRHGGSAISPTRAS